jgi:nitroimidazol reductase NimA-like FMN-containing flavoprotein (pyridoxamine 5'-phosphate oxidase superfamily)
MSVKSWHILDFDECQAMLEARHLGRVAFVDQDGPIILPINYALVDGLVVFRTHAGAKLDAARRGASFAFEVDGFDPREQTGWSVVVRGTAELVTDEVELAMLAALPLVSWAPGAKPIYVRIGQAEVTGQRISAPDLPSHWWG